MAKTVTETLKFYNGEIEITFYPNSHQYKLNGETLPSPSKIAGIIDKSGPLTFWVAKEASKAIEEAFEKGSTDKETLLKCAYAFRDAQKEALDVGSAIHDYCEQYAQAVIDGNNQPTIPDAQEEIVNGIQAFLRWVEENHVEFIAVEKTVFSREHVFVGRFDLLARVNGVLTLCDFKSSKAIYPLEMGVQLACYQIAYEEEYNEQIEQRMIIRFGKDDGQFETEVFTDHERDKKAALSCLHLLNLKKLAEKPGYNQSQVEALDL